MSLHLQPVRVATGSGDGKGRLVLADGGLVAVLVRLSEQRGPEAGKWFFEVGFGGLACPEHPTLADLDEAQNWIVQRLG